MRILLVTTNRNKNPVTVMPYGACLVAEAADHAGHRVTLLDLMFVRDPGAALAQAISRARPEVIGLSIRNIDNNDKDHSVMFFEELGPLMAVIRRRSSAPVILGGAAVSVMPEALLRYTGADFAGVGDGTVLLPQFLEACERHPGQRPAGVAGLAWLEDGRYRCTPRVDEQGMHSLPVPDFARWLAAPAYRSLLTSAPLQSKRGCPFKCVYCTYAGNEGKTYRLAAPASVVRAVRSLRAQGFRDVEFVDNVFNAPYDHALALCRELAAARTGVHFQTVEMNPRFIDEPLLAAMETAGFTGIGITAESAADPVLAGLGKEYTAREVRQAAVLSARFAMPVFWMFLLGGPGETRATVRQTLAFAADHVRPRDIAFFNVGVRVYPGTQLEAIARRQGVLTVPPGAMLRTVTYVSPQVDADWVAEQVQRTAAHRANFIHSASLNFTFLPVLFRAGYRLGLRPPLWKHACSLRRVFRTLGVNV
jgi:radical SAM superfamily enzyme YgiQ (UPF0313 family)